MEGWLAGHDLSRFTPILVYEVNDDLAARLIEMGRAIPDSSLTPAMTVRPDTRAILYRSADGRLLCMKHVLDIPVQKLTEEGWVLLAEADSEGKQCGRCAGRDV